MVDFTTLTLVDYGIVFVFVLSATMSILRGITREILGLAGWGVSILIANFSAPIFEDPIGGHSALAAGQIDIYLCTGDYTPITIDSNTPVTNVAFLNPSYGVDHIVLSPNQEINALKGKKVSAPQAYIGHLLMGLFLEKNGIPTDDVEWVNLNADEAVGPMMSGDLSAAYMYEPWISNVVENRPGTTSVINTADPDMLKTGIFMDVMYMNTNFIESRRKVALDMLKARWDAVQYWHDNTDDVNKLFAEYLKWPAEDIGFVIGTNGKYLSLIHISEPTRPY